MSTSVSQLARRSNSQLQSEFDQAAPLEMQRASPGRGCGNMALLRIEAPRALPERVTCECASDCPGVFQPVEKPKRIAGHSFPGTVRSVFRADSLSWAMRSTCSAKYRQWLAKSINCALTRRSCEWRARRSHSSAFARNRSAFDGRSKVPTLKDGERRGCVFVPMTRHPSQSSGG
jgi:hypothetical protein